MFRWRGFNRFFCESSLPIKNDFINYFTVLGVKNGASDTQIKQAYLTKITKCHPDLNPNASENEYKMIEEAYNVLSNSATRNAYEQKTKSLMAKQNATYQNQLIKETRLKYLIDLDYKSKHQDKFHFSEKLYKQYHQKYLKPQKAYKRYQGNQQEYFEHDDAQPQWLKKIGVAIFIVVVVLSTKYILHETGVVDKKKNQK